MNREKLERYGNELTISGIVVGNGTEQEIIMFRGEDLENSRVFVPTVDELNEIFNQLDTLQITGIEKVVLRKSQRNIEQGISWTVFKRDGYKCRYCGRDDVPLTVDHVVRWENLGDSVERNLICACRKCNKTRGNTEYPDWLKSDYYLKVSANLSAADLQRNIEAWAIAQSVPLRPRMRSR